MRDFARLTDMRVFFLTTEFPWPPISGSRVRTLAQLKLLAGLREVKQLTIVTLREDLVSDGDVQALEREVPGVRVSASVFHPIHLKRFPYYFAWVAVLRVTRRMPYLAAKWVSRRVSRAVEATLRDPFDVVYVDHLGMSVYLDLIRRTQPRARVILEQHNVESDFFAQFLARQTNPVIAALAKDELTLALRFESRTMRRVDAVVAISAADARVFEEQSAVRAHVVPQVVHPQRTSWAKANRSRLVYLGNLAWQPNVAGLDWFVREVWPLVRERLPEAQFDIGGAGLPTGTIPAAWRGPGVTVTGLVPDVSEHYADAVAFVAPILGGSGVRLKALEAIRAGLPLITTPAGALGLPIVHGARRARRQRCARVRGVHCARLLRRWAPTIPSGWRVRVHRNAPQLGGSIARDARSAGHQRRGLRPPRLMLAPPISHPSLANEYPPLPKPVRIGRFETVFVVLLLLVATDSPLSLIPAFSRAGADDTAGNAATQALWLVIYAGAIVFSRPVWRQYKTIVVADPFLGALLALALISASWSDFAALSFRRSLALCATSFVGLYLGARFGLALLLRRLCYAMGLAILVSIVYAVATPLGLETDDHAGAWRGMYGTKNLLGQVMTIAIVAFLLNGGGSRSQRAASLVGVAASLALLGLSTSVSSVLVCGVMLIGVTMLAAVRWDRRATALLYVVAGMVAVVAGAIVAPHVDALLSAAGRDTSMTGRTPLWAASVDQFLRHPVLGWGWGSFWIGWMGEGSSRVWHVVGWEPGYAHNGFLDVLLGIGSLGLSLLLGSMLLNLARALRLARSDRPRWRLWPCALLLLAVLSNTTEGNFLQQNNILWVLYVATSVATGLELAHAGELRSEDAAPPGPADFPSLLTSGGWADRATRGRTRRALSQVR